MRYCRRCQHPQSPSCFLKFFIHPEVFFRPFTTALIIFILSSNKYIPSGLLGIRSHSAGLRIDSVTFSAISVFMVKLKTGPEVTVSPQRRRTCCSYFLWELDCSVEACCSASCSCWTGSPDLLNFNLKKTFHPGNDLKPEPPRLDSLHLIPLFSFFPFLEPHQRPPVLS